MARPETSVRETAKYKYDPHLDPQLVWAGKEERDAAGLSVDTISLHIHERGARSNFWSASRTVC